MAVTSRRERALQVVLVVLGSVDGRRQYLSAGDLARGPAPDWRTTAPMFYTILATLGVFLVLAARNPSAHRSLIAYAVWSSFAHTAVMVLMAIQLPTRRGELLAGVAVTAWGPCCCSCWRGLQPVLKERSPFRVFSMKPRPRFGKSVSIFSDQRPFCADQSPCSVRRPVLWGREPMSRARQQSSCREQGASRRRRGGCRADQSRLFAELAARASRRFLPPMGSAAV